MNSAFGIILVMAAFLSLPKETAIRTDCFRGMSGNVPAHIAWAEARRTDEAFVVWVGRRLSPGERPRACGKALPPESMFLNGGETVELAIAPDAHDPSLYYHFIANPSNELYAACRRDTSWRPSVPVRSRAVVEEGRWGVEFTVPYAAFGLAMPAEGDSWRVNFAMLDDNWANVSDYHDPRQFGTVTFGGARPRATVESVTVGGDGLLHVSFALPLEQKDGEIPHKPDGAERSFALTEGSDRLATFDVRMPSWNAGDFTLDGFYFPSGKAFGLSYHARDFHTSRILIRKLDDNAVAATYEGRPPSGTLEVGPLAAGEYAFEMDDGRVRSACPFEVVDAFVPAPCEGPHYPIVGSAALSSDWLSFRNVLPGRFTWTGFVGIVYDRSKPLYGARSRVKDDEKVLYRIAYEAQHRVKLQDGAKGELEPVADSAAFYRETYRQLKEAFPNRRFSIHVDDPARAAEFAQACDVFEYAKRGCSYSPGLLGGLREAVSEALGAAGGRPTVFWLGVSVPDRGVSRTAEELNTAIRYCVLKGLAGNVFHLGHGGVPQSSTRLWSFMRGCEKAVNAWYPVWAKGKDVFLAAEADAGIVYGLRTTDDGRAVLVAVNLDKYERSIRYEDPFTKKTRTLRLPGCGSAVVRW